MVKKYWAISVAMCAGSRGAASLEELVEIPVGKKKMQTHQSHLNRILTPNYHASPENGEKGEITQAQRCSGMIQEAEFWPNSDSCSFLEL